MPEASHEGLGDRGFWAGGKPAQGPRSGARAGRLGWDSGVDGVGQVGRTRS